MRSAWTVASEPMEYARAVARGIVLKRVAMNLCRAGPIPACRPTLDPCELEARLDKMSGEELQPALIQMSLTGPEALASLGCVIDQAQCRLDVLMYIWDNDPVGWDIAQRLAAKAGPQLPVRVLVDGGGSLLQGTPKEASAKEVNAVECWLARQPYVQLIRTRDPWNRHDHRKLVVADGHTAWTGGRNFSEVSFFKVHDVSFTVAGPLAAEMDAVFEDFWQEQGGLPGVVFAPPPEPPVNARARLVQSGPCNHGLEHALYEAVDRACHHVYAENPYFSDDTFEFKLAQARKRGADVRVVLTESDVSDSVNRSNRVTANRLLRAGIRVYIYPIMTHVKASSVDGRWAYLGTGNFDRLSLRHNHEIGVAVADGPLIQELEETVFLPDFQPEWEVTEPFPLRLSDYLVEAFVSLFL